MLTGVPVHQTQNNIGMNSQNVSYCVKWQCSSSSLGYVTQQPHGQSSGTVTNQHLEEQGVMHYNDVILVAIETVLTFVNPLFLAISTSS